jgi:hypothetical protein
VIPDVRDLLAADQTLTEHATALADAATEGDWEAVRDDHGRKGIEHSVWAGDHTGAYVAEWIRNQADAEFIAWSRTGVPDLVARLGTYSAALTAVLDLRRTGQWSEHAADGYDIALRDVHRLIVSALAGDTPNPTGATP